jgi:hypothetical protein
MIHLLEHGIGAEFACFRLYGVNANLRFGARTRDTQSDHELQEGDGEMRIASMLAGMLVLMIGATQANADPLKLSQVPASAKWLAHVDVDAMRSSKVFQEMYQQCIVAQGRGELIDRMGQMWGLDVRQDLHAVTLYGNRMVRGQGVLIVKATMDSSTVLDKARKAHDYRSQSYHDHEMHAWTPQKGAAKQQVAGSFVKPDVLVLASSVDLLKSALDVLDGNSDSLQGKDAQLAGAVPPGTMFLARAAGIDKSLAGDEHAICAALESLDYAEGQHDHEWFGNLSVKAKDEAVAERIASTMEGAVSLLWLQASSTPKLQQLFAQVKTERDETGVNCSFRAPVTQIVEAVPEMCRFITNCCGAHPDQARTSLQQ